MTLSRATTSLAIGWAWSDVYVHLRPSTDVDGRRRAWCEWAFSVASTAVSAISPSSILLIPQITACRDTVAQWRDIRNRKFVPPKNVGQSSPKSLKTFYPLRPPIIPNFIEIGQSSLEKSVTKIGPQFFCHGRT